MKAKSKSTKGKLSAKSSWKQDANWQKNHALAMLKAFGDEDAEYQLSRKQNEISCAC